MYMILTMSTANVLVDDNMSENTYISENTKEQYLPLKD